MNPFAKPILKLVAYRRQLTAENLKDLQFVLMRKNSESFRDFLSDTLICISVKATATGLIESNKIWEIVLEFADIKEVSTESYNKVDFNVALRDFQFRIQE